MMKKILLALTLVSAPVAYLACSDESSNNEDLATKDMTASGDSCYQLISCAASCAGMSACQNACVAKGSTKAQMQFQALFACSYGQCTVAHDGGSPACTSTTDTSAACQGCVYAAGQGSACSTQLAACTTGN